MQKLRSYKLSVVRLSSRASVPTRQLDFLCGRLIRHDCSSTWTWMCCWMEGIEVPCQHTWRHGPDPEAGQAVAWDYIGFSLPGWSWRCNDIMVLICLLPYLAVSRWQGTNRPAAIPCLTIPHAANDTSDWRTGFVSPMRKLTACPAIADRRQLRTSSHSSG